MTNDISTIDAIEAEMEFEVHISDIDWDREVDGRNVHNDLPSQASFTVWAFSEDEAEDMALSKLSDETGFCVTSSFIEAVAK